jgi:hypothetical protein
VTPEDVPRLLEIVREPSVAQHWSPLDEDHDREALMACGDPDGAERVTTFVITLAGETIGPRPARCA